VIPRWAPDNWVESVFIALSTPTDFLSPESAASLTVFRFTVISENSAATNKPQPTISNRLTRIEATSTCYTPAAVQGALAHQRGGTDCAPECHRE
jgi:hypothetical protein